MFVGDSQVSFEIQLILFPYLGTIKLLRSEVAIDQNVLDNYDP